MTRPPPPARQAFPAFRPAPLRWGDNDVYGHMNNVVHYALFDTAINGWLIEAGLLDPRGGTAIGLVVETNCRYFAELAFPDRVEAGFGVEKIGATSVTYRIALFREGEPLASAEGRFVHVYVDAATRRPRPLDARWRETLATILL